MTKSKALTEAQWHGGKTPWDLLRFLEQHRRITRVPGGRRRVSLFVCACCRLAWHLFDDAAARQAVEVAERGADGLATRQELDVALEEADAVYHAANRRTRQPPRAPEHWPAHLSSLTAGAAASVCRRQYVILNAQLASSSLVQAVSLAAERQQAGTGKGAGQAMESRHLELLRDLFGNPFRPMPTLDPSWLTWNAGLVPRMARTLYEERAFDRLPILADALEEAGCTEALLLGHLRSEGTHWRGCHTLDAILGKE